MAKILFWVMLSFFVDELKAQNHITISDISVLKEPATEMMRDYLTRLVDEQFSVRDSILATLRMDKDWDNRAKLIRDSIASWTGPFPERSPLNARVTGRIERKDYVIEKIIFESRPGFAVSANLYLPKNFSGKRPAILNVVGHSDAGKATEKTQRICIAQAKKGFVSLVIDGLGQGERKIYGLRVGMAHQNIGTQAFIAGTHVFNFMVWDAIRAIDYLVSRKDVDSESIGITGSSGGGMMSTYILPLDDRIAVSVPTCNPNTWSYRVHAGLATDHEQVFFGAFEATIDPRGDPLFAHAPKPLLINATSDDHLNPPRGVWDLSAWLYRSYASHGVPEKFSTSMVRAAHDYNREQREVTYAWMLRWMGGNAENFTEENAPVENEETLWVTEKGNVYAEPGSRHPHEWVLDYLTEHRYKEKTINTKKELRQFKADMAGSIVKILNMDPHPGKIGTQTDKAYTAGNLDIVSFVLEPDAGIKLPGVILGSKTGSHKNEIILYLNPEGKSGILEDWEIVQEILQKGYRVCAVDLRGMGETSPDMAGKMWDFLAGKPIFGQRIKDVLAVTGWLKKSGYAKEGVRIWASGLCAFYGAFAGVLSDGITLLVLDKPLLSFESVVEANEPAFRDEVMLPGILERFDMPQIYQALCPRPVLVLNPRLGDRSPAGKEDVRPVNRVVKATYRSLKKGEAWWLMTADEHERGRVIKDVLTGE